MTEIYDRLAVLRRQFDHFRAGILQEKWLDETIATIFCHGYEDDPEAAALLAKLRNEWLIRHGWKSRD